MTTLVETPSAVKVDTTKPPAKPSKPRPPRKPKPAADRTLRMIEEPRPESGDYFALRIVEGKKMDIYIVVPVPADFGEGYSFEKLDAAADFATLEQYDVNLAGKESTCTCKGNTYCGHCRHVEALQALDAKGKLPRRSLARQKHAACNNCGELTEAPGLCAACEEDQAYYNGRLEAEARDAW